MEDFGVGLLLNAKQVKKIICSYIGANKNAERLYLSGEVEIELTPQGTLAEKLRAGGAGIPAFYTATAVGTAVQEGGFPTKYNKDKTVAIGSRPRESRIFNGRTYLMEEALTCEYSLVKAWKGDTNGNLVFHATARNFNPDIAKAGKVCIAEVEQLVQPGEIAPDEIHLPGIYVNRIIQGQKYEKRIVKLTLSGDVDTEIDASRERIAKRAALEFRDGMYVNLGKIIKSIIYGFGNVFQVLVSPLWLQTTFPRV